MDQARGRFLETLDTGVLLGDGAMGTELFRRGVPRDRCLPELNLTRPDLVQAIHEDYARAGARVHRTNSFTANRPCLEPFGLADKVREINRAAVEIARQAAGADGFVAGSVGPLPANEPFIAYAEQVNALRESGCDLILLETFVQGSKLKSAIASLPSPRGLFAISVAMPDRNRAVESLCDVQSQNADLAGMNCVPAALAAGVLEGLAQEKKTLAFPSPGPPGQVASPKEFAEACAPLADLGVKILGGCCGAGPEHIRALAAILRRRRPSA